MSADSYALHRSGRRAVRDTACASARATLAIDVVHNLRKLVHAMIKMGFDPLDLKMASSM
ncbi:MAG: hypothetical protein ACHREM_29145 [Polyangiales bacterium]